MGALHTSRLINDSSPTFGKRPHFILLFIVSREDRRQVFEVIGSAKSLHPSIKFGILVVKVNLSKMGIIIFSMI
jgi:hypothetical protein